MSKERNLIVLGAFGIGQALQIAAAAVAKDLNVSNSLLWTAAVGIVVTLLVGLGMAVAVWNSDTAESEKAKAAKK